jgi:hypothetical protein
MQIFADLKLKFILSRWDTCDEVQLSGYKYYIPMGLFLLGQNVYRT